MARPKSKKLPLTAENLRRMIAYNSDTGLFVWLIYRSRIARVNSSAGCPTTEGYVGIKIDGRLYKAHRLAWLYHYGEWPPTQIDHINRNRSDNRIENLRLASHKDNASNCSKRADNTSGIKGVDKPGRCKRWRARIQSGNRPVVIGYFDTMADAANAYAEAALDYHGDFASIDRG